ncbi:MAG: cation transporter [Pseudomonas sp.]|nr:cation transporter [Pseudomonas sp.]
MNLQELTAFAHAGRVDELNLISMEGGIYLLEARMRGMSHPLNDVSGKTLHLRSVEHARDLLHALPKMPFNLVHSVVHDEMCGLRDVDEQTLRVPISFRSTW